MSALEASWNIAPFADRMPIGRGTQGTEETLALAANTVARSLEDPNFPLWVRRKVLAEPGLDPRDIRSVFERIYNFTKDNVGYQPDPLTLGEDGDAVYDYIQTPHWTWFVEGFGDCLAHASAEGSLAVALGHGFAYRTFKADRSAPWRFSHVYALLGTKDALTGSDIWVPADTTVPSYGLGDEPPELASLSPRDFIVAPAS